MTDCLAQIEWHDLPLESIRIGSTGIDLHVTPFDREKGRYQDFYLFIFNPQSIEIKAEGHLSLERLKNLEIAEFEYEFIGDLISGTIGIIPGGADVGYWKIEFKKANWKLTSSGS